MTADTTAPEQQANPEAAATWSGPATAPRVRPARRVTAAVLAAIVLGGAGATVAVDVVRVRLGMSAWIWPHHAIATRLSDQHWDDTVILAVAGAIVVIGLVLLATAARPGRRADVPLATHDPGVRAALTPRSLSRTVTAATLDVDGVHHVQVTARRRSLSVRADSILRDPAGLSEQVSAAVERRLAELDLAHPPAIRVRVRRKES